VASFRMATGRAIDYAVDGSLPKVVADQGGLVTVIDHLLDNAAKYSPATEPITVTVAEEGDWVRIAVADRGIGMDEDQVNHCFDRFWQAESSQTRRYGGTGIGLYIVKSLADAMGALVRVSSELGEGTTFTLLVRRTDRVGARTDDDQERSDAVAAGVGESNSIREFMRQIGVPQGGGM